jgi:uncharacterized protein (DUF362 family)
MPPLPLSRRGFFRLAALVGVSGAAIIIDQALKPIGLSRAANWIVSGEVKRQIGKPATVGLGRCEKYNEREIFDCLSELWHQSDMPEVAGKRILLKPNLLDYIEPYPITTAPQVIGAIIDLLRELGVEEIVVGEGSAFRRDLGSVAAATGLLPILERRNVRLVDLNYDDPKPIRTRGGWFLKTDEVWLPYHVREADLILSIPKLKTHHWAGVSLSLKNLFGVVPGSRYGWPKNFLHFNDIAMSILGMYKTVPNTISIVDGIVGMEGDGPLFGSPVQHGVLAIGRDPVAVDNICANLMGFSSDDIGHLFLANWAGVGQGEKINTVGISPDQITIPYENPPTA